MKNRITIEFNSRLKLSDDDRSFLQCMIGETLESALQYLELSSKFTVVIPCRTEGCDQYVGYLGGLCGECRTGGELD